MSSYFIIYRASNPIDKADNWTRGTIQASKRLAAEHLQSCLGHLCGPINDLPTPKSFQAVSSKRSCRPSKLRRTCFKLPSPSLPRQAISSQCSFTFFAIWFISPCKRALTKQVTVKRIQPLRGWLSRCPRSFHFTSLKSMRLNFLSPYRGHIFCKKKTTINRW